MFSIKPKYLKKGHLEVVCVLHPGHFWSQCTKKWAQKLNSTLSKSFFLIKQLETTLLLCESYWRKNMAKEKHKDFRSNMQQLPKLQSTIVTSFLTCNRWLLKATYTLFIHGPKLLISIQNSYWGKNGLLTKFYLLMFSVKKKQVQISNGPPHVNN